MRVVGETVELDYGATARFFEGRGQRLEQVGALSAVLYQDRQPELAQRRSAHEMGRIEPLVVGQRRELAVLDVGCGTGRWAERLAPHCARYVGIDFCEAFLESSRALVAGLEQPARFRFQRVDLSQPMPQTLAADRFDAILMAGVLIYLNDDDARRVLDTLAGMLAPQGRLYLREPLGVHERLTLKEHFSDDLSAHYSSVYRARSQFDGWVSDCAGRHGLRVLAGDALYPAELDNRAETRQFFTLLQREARA